MPSRRRSESKIESPTAQADRFLAMFHNRAVVSINEVLSRFGDPSSWRRVVRNLRARGYDFELDRDGIVSGDETGYLHMTKAPREQAGTLKKARRPSARQEVAA